MSSNPSPPPVPPASEHLQEITPKQQVQFQTKEGQLWIILPPETEGSNSKIPLVNTWLEIWQQVKHRLNGGERFWQPITEVHRIADDRLLDGRQLQSIADALAEVKLQLVRIHTRRRQTAVMAATAGYCVEQQTTPSTNLTPTPNTSATALADPLYLETTVRSGVEIRHPGSIIVIGDVNPGGELIANGDILVWGRLRGLAHAGAGGNGQCIVMALQMEPTQIRIAEFVARTPETPPGQYYPEVAYVSSAGIRITRAADFSRTN